LILVDTSIWIDHLRAAGGSLAPLLEDGAEGGTVCCHPWVIGELACGNLGRRQEILGLLRALPSLAPATDDEALYFIEKQQLMGRGIGYIDVHLLAACALHATQLWTRDRRLDEVAAELGLAYRVGSH